MGSTAFVGCGLFVLRNDREGDGALMAPQLLTSEPHGSQLVLPMVGDFTAMELLGLGELGRLDQHLWRRSSQAHPRWRFFGLTLIWTDFRVRLSERLVCATSSTLRLRRPPPALRPQPPGERHRPDQRQGQRDAIMIQR
jgi:hypothetical protein